MPEPNALGSTFFPQFKKQVRLQDFKQLQTKADEKRKKLYLSLELSVETVQGMPSWIADAYQLLTAKDTHAERVVFGKSTDMPGMTIESWDTADTRERHLLLTGCDFRKFVLRRAGIGEAARFFLEWTVYTSDSTELHRWSREYYHCEMAMRFEQGQMTFPLTAPDEDDDKDDEDEDDENSDTMNPARDEEFHGKPTRRKTTTVQ